MNGLQSRAECVERRHVETGAVCNSRGTFEYERSRVAMYRQCVCQRRNDFHQRCTTAWAAPRCRESIERDAVNKWPFYCLGRQRELKQTTWTRKGVRHAF